MGKYLHFEAVKAQMTFAEREVAARAAVSAPPPLPNADAVTSQDGPTAASADTGAMTAQSGSTVEEAGVSAMTAQAGSTLPAARTTPTMWTDCSTAPYNAEQVESYGAILRGLLEESRVQPGTPTYTVPLLPGDYVYSEKPILDRPSLPEVFDLSQDDVPDEDPSDDSDADEVIEKVNIDANKLRGQLRNSVLSATRDS